MRVRAACRYCEAEIMNSWPSPSSHCLTHEAFRFSLHLEACPGCRAMNFFSNAKKLSREGLSQLGGAADAAKKTLNKVRGGDAMQHGPPSYTASN